MKVAFTLFNFIGILFCFFHLNASSDPCQPTQLSYILNHIGSFEGGLTPTIDTIYPCSDLSAQKMWFRLDLLEDFNNHSFLLQKEDSLAEVSLIIGNWETNCQGKLSFINKNVYCGPATEPIQFKCLPPGQYIILLSTSKSAVFNFSLQYSVDTQVPNCGQNHRCTDPLHISSIPINGTSACRSGCNINTCGEDFEFTGCDLTRKVIWYSFDLPSTETPFDVKVSMLSNDFNPMLQFFSNACQGIALSSCLIGSGGQLMESNVRLSHQGRVYVAVGTEDGREGTFDVCFQINQVLNNCSLNSRLTTIDRSMNSPPFGPFKPGEKITFKYDFVFSSANNSCQWLHSIIPNFGSRWDLVESNLQNQLYNGNFRWFDQDIVHYNAYNPFVFQFIDDNSNIQLCYPANDPNCTGLPLQDGTFLPAGWYWISQPGNCNGPVSDPNNTWGMPCACGSACSYSLEFTLYMKDIDEMWSLPGLYDASILLFDFSDRQTGCWQGGGHDVCAGNIPFYSQTKVIICEEVPALADSFTVCSGMSLFEVLDLPGVPEGTEYEWTPVNNTQVSGLKSGLGKNFIQYLKNHSQEPQTVQLEVTTVYPNGCRSEIPGLIEITVDPPIEGIILANSTTDTLCTMETVELNVQFDNADPQVLNLFWLHSGDTTNSSEFIMTEFGLNVATIEVTDEFGCVTRISKEFFGLESPDIYLDISLDTAHFGIVQANISGGAFPWTIVWSNGHTGELVSDLLPGEYDVTVTDANGCSTVEIFSILDCSAEISVDYSEEVRCYGVNEGYINVMVANTNTNPAILWMDGNTNFERTELAAGLYVAEITDSLCIYDIGIFIGTTDIEEIIITGPQGFCEGSSTEICAMSYDTYLWSTGQTTECIEVNQAGAYIVESPLPDGCKAVGEISIMEEFVPEIHIVGPMILSCLADTIELCINDFVTITWSTGDTSECLEITEPGTYSLTVTFIGGCTNDTSFEIENNVNEIIFDEIIITHPEEGGALGMLEAVISGGHSPYIYRWFDDNGLEVGVDPIVSNLPDGIYTLEIVDAEGCLYFFGPFELILTTSTKDLERMGIRVFPNPFNHEIYVENSMGVEIRSIRLLTSAGSMMQYIQSEDSNNLILPVNHIPSGVYFLEIATDAGVYVHTLLKQE